MIKRTAWVGSGWENGRWGLFINGVIICLLKNPPLQDDQVGLTLLRACPKINTYYIQTQSLMQCYQYCAYSLTPKIISCHQLAPPPAVPTSDDVSYEQALTSHRLTVNNKS